MTLLNNCSKGVDLMGLIKKELISWELISWDEPVKFMSDNQSLNCYDTCVMFTYPIAIVLSKFYYFCLVM